MSKTSSQNSPEFSLEVCPFTDEKLDVAGPWGEGDSEFVAQAMKTTVEDPKLLGESLTFKSLSSPVSPTVSDASSSCYLSGSAHTFGSDTTSVAPYVLSDWEKAMYYNGISPDHPELLYRSNLLDDPFVIPKGRHPHLPTKTAYGVFNTALNPVWRTVAPQIRELLKARKIRYSAIKAARFVTHGEDGKDSTGPIVIWISTHPTTTTAENAHDTSPDILTLLKDNGVEGAVIEWYEGAIEKLGPQLLRVTDDTDPTHHVRRFLTAALGMPLTTAESEAADAQGSLAFFFHENKDKHGAPSAKVFGVSNCHVLRKDTTIEYKFKGAGEPPQHVRLAGSRRFQRGLNDIKGCISGYETNADLLAREIVELEAKPKSEDQEEAAKDKVALDAKREKLAKAKKDIGVLEAFYKDTRNQWAEIACRNIGQVDWAPQISVDVEGHRYTKDIGTFEVDAAMFKAHFKGNVVDLGTKYTPQQLSGMFYPNSAGRTTFRFPTNRQLRINGCLTRKQLAIPDCFDRNGEPCLIVMKDGNSTDLTVGRYVGLEVFLCDELGVESMELAIYNYDKQSGPFSAKGDSGSLIFDGEGHMVGILHSGDQKRSKHVTYATPAWWAIEQIRLHYPHADFDRTTF